MDIKTRFDLGDKVFVIHNNLIMKDKIHRIVINIHGNEPTRELNIIYHFIDSDGHSLYERSEHEVYATADKLFREQMEMEIEG